MRTVLYMRNIFSEKIFVPTYFFFALRKGLNLILFDIHITQLEMPVVVDNVQVKIKVRQYLVVSPLRNLLNATYD